MSVPPPSDASENAGARDLELVRAVLRREQAAVAGFIARMDCIPRMIAVRNNRAGAPLSETELEDLAQDVVTAVWRKLGSFDGRARLETWVYQFCYLEFLRRLRSLRNRPRAVGEPVGDEVEERRPASSRASEYEELHRCFAELSSAEAGILRLKHFEDLTFEEIGARLDLSPNTVKTRYYRALGKLRRRMGQSRVEPSAGGAS